MNLTPKLKAWAVENLSVDKDAGDDVFIAAIEKAVEDGTLTKERLAELQAEPKAAADAIAKTVAEQTSQAVADALAPVAKAMGEMAAGVAKLAGIKQPDPPSEPPEQPDTKAVEAMIEKKIAAMNLGTPAAADPNFADMVMLRGSEADPDSVTRVRVKSAVERYDSTKKAAICPDRKGSGARHPMAGMQASFGGRLLDQPSQKDSAVMGAWIKYKLFGSLGLGGEARLNEHEKALLAHTLHEEPFVGTFDEHGEDVGDRKLTDLERKAILDDSTSGGTYAVPTVFDERITLTPILEGELVPMVEIVNLARGNKVDGSKWTDPSVTWGTAEGTSLTLITTTGLISNLDTTCFPVNMMIELGLDWESDSPINFGTLIPQRMGLKLAETLDEQIAIGDGTQEPEGVFTASGTNVLASASGTSGPFTIGDFEELIFGLSKAMRKSGGTRCAFITTDTMYRRARSVPVTTSDARRILGYNHEAYTILEKATKINNSITDGDIGYCNFAFYRLFRRLGMQIRVSTEGATLMRTNTKLIGMRARYGGRLRLGSAFAYITDGPMTG